MSAAGLCAVAQPQAVRPAPPCAPRVLLAAQRAVGGGPREPSSGPYVTNSEFPEPGTREVRPWLR